MRKSSRATRRGFLKAAAVAGAGVAASGTFTNVAAQEEQVWDQETDVVVVGSGYAGLCAAIEAANAGAEVIILEKGPYLGGNSILSAGNSLFAQTHVQERLGVEDHWEWQYEDQMEYGFYRAVPELLRSATEGGADTCLWLEQLGLVWRDSVGQADENNRVGRAHGPDEGPTYIGRRGISIWLVLYNEVQRLGIPIQMAKMTRIIREPDGGPVTGVEIEAEGETSTIKARKAVLLASGGWKSNVRFRMAWDPRLDDDLGAGGLPYVETTGEGILSALDVGAGLTDMSYVCEFRIRWGTRIYQTWEPPSIDTVPGGSGLPVSDYSRVMIVQNEGRRFVNELAASTYPEEPFFDAFLNLPFRPRNAWAITDDDGAAALGWSREAFENPDPTTPPALFEDMIAVADSIEELAEMIGVPAENLVDEVERYNSFLDMDRDPDFGKPRPLYRIATPPFFAAKLMVMAHDQQGGLRANTQGQVLDRTAMFPNGGPISIDEEPVIPRLYAAGECVGGYVGARRAHGKISFYMTAARIAGRAAAAEEPLP
jgi:urocanate reductase